MTSRYFRGIPSIQEVECWGTDLSTDVKLISLKLVRLPESTVLASLNVITSNCMTYGEFSSCFVHPSETHKSKVRVLVHDLEEGEDREYGCTANTVNPQGDPVLKNWKILVRRKSKSGAGARFVTLSVCCVCMKEFWCTYVFRSRKRRLIVLFYCIVFYIVLLYFVLFCFVYFWV